MDAFTGDFGTLAGWSLTFEPFDFACNIPGSNVSVSGRVVDGGGRGIAKVYVSMTDGSNNYIVSTNTFGYFTFPAVHSAIEYTLTPSSKNYTFTPHSTKDLA